MPNPRAPKIWSDATNSVSDAEGPLWAPEAANDSVSNVEMQNLDTTVGSYERLTRIRKRLVQGDVWIAIAVYFLLGSIAFVIF